jgi:tRNA(Ile)-lysidine synthase
LIAKNVIQIEKKSKWQTSIDAQTVNHGLLIRTWQEGDRIQPLGMKGTKPLKKIWQENKIPLETRKTLPILCHQGEIVWIPGCCESDHYKISDQTEAIVQITIHPIE